MQEVAAIRKDGFPEFFGPADDYSTAAREQACREAWAFLNAHSLFRVGKVGSFSRCITISLIPSYLVAEEIQKYDHDPIGHCWKVECGPPMEMGMFSWQTGCYERPLKKRSSSSLAKCSSITARSNASRQHATGSNLWLFLSVILTKLKFYASVRSSFQALPRKG